MLTLQEVLRLLQDLIFGSRHRGRNEDRLIKIGRGPVGIATGAEHFCMPRLESVFGKSLIPFADDGLSPTQQLFVLGCFFLAFSQGLTQRPPVLASFSGAFPSDLGQLLFARSFLRDNCSRSFLRGLAQWLARTVFSVANSTDAFFQARLSEHVAEIKIGLPVRRRGDGATRQAGFTEA